MTFVYFLATSHYVTRLYCTIDGCPGNHYLERECARDKRPRESELKWMHCKWILRKKKLLKRIEELYFTYLQWRLKSNWFSRLHLVERLMLSWNNFPTNTVYDNHFKQYKKFDHLLFNSTRFVWASIGVDFIWLLLHAWLRPFDNFDPSETLNFSKQLGAYFFLYRYECPWLLSFENQTLFHWWSI